MNLAETNVVLTEAALLDSRMKRVDVDEAEARAEAWCRLLADVPYLAAMHAVRDHYRESSEVLMPAHIVARVAPVDPWAHVRDVDAEIEAERRAALEGGVA